MVFHSAVAAYLPTSDRDRFDELMRGLVADGACHWVSNEAPRVLPDGDGDRARRPAAEPTFVLGVDGRAVAWTHGHGRTLDWSPDRRVGLTSSAREVVRWVRTGAMNPVADVGPSVLSGRLDERGASSE